MSICRVFLCIVCLLSVRTIQAGQIVASGSISTSDLLGHDTLGQFYYDVYDVTVTQTSTLTISMQAGPNMIPWMALWGSVVLPTSDFDTIYGSALQNNNTSSALGDLISLSPFIAQPGVTYQLAVSPLEYLPTTHLDSYQLTIDYSTPDGTVVATPVPEPATLTLIGLGLASICLGRHRRQPD